MVVHPVALPQPLPAFLDMAKYGGCESTFLNVDFSTAQGLPAVTNVLSFSDCRQHCEAAPGCKAFTWGIQRDVLDVTNVCFMKQLQDGESLGLAANSSLISGLPCKVAPQALPPVQPLPGQASETPAPLLPPAAASTALPTTFPAGSLYCFALMQAAGYERSLIQMQHDMRSGIFLCDEYAIYSNERIELAPNIFTLVVDNPLKCDTGGEFQTALNNAIFLAVWTKVISVGRFRFHAWTVKVDPDAVFFPHRLRPIVTQQQETPEGVYLNNCKFGLHGPIEVLSRNAVLNWAKGSAKCVLYFHQLCSGPCFWGEDIFLDQCMERVLNAKRVNVWELLTESHCDPPPRWDECLNTATVAFHPFKTIDSWQICLRDSLKTEGISI